MHWCPHRVIVSLGGCSHFSPRTFRFSLFGPWTQLVCRILAGGCSGVSRVCTVRVSFRVTVRVRDRCVQGLKCPKTEVTIHQFGPIYLTSITAMLQFHHRSSLFLSDWHNGLWLLTIFCISGFVLVPCGRLSWLLPAFDRTLISHSYLLTVCMYVHQLCHLRW